MMSDDASACGKMIPLQKWMSQCLHCLVVHWVELFIITWSNLYILSITYERTKPIQREGLNDLTAEAEVLASSLVGRSRPSWWALLFGKTTLPPVVKDSDLIRLILSMRRIVSVMKHRTPPWFELSEVRTSSNWVLCADVCLYWNELVTVNKGECVFPPLRLSALWHHVPTGVA